MESTDKLLLLAGHMALLPTSHTGDPLSTDMVAVPRQVPRAVRVS